MVNEEEEGMCLSIVYERVDVRKADMEWKTKAFYRHSIMNKLKRPISVWMGWKIDAFNTTHHYGNESACEWHGKLSLDFKISQRRRKTTQNPEGIV